MMKKDHDAVNLFHRYPAKNRNEKFILKLNSFKYQGLFDIAACKCNIDSCSCEIKIPKTEGVFLEDQRTCRKQNVGSARRTRIQLDKNRMISVRCTFWYTINRTN